MGRKTDNRSLEAKLELRRYFLGKYHADQPITVFDCCQGSGLIWSRLGQEFELDRYWGVDLKPKKGRLKVDSVRVLEQGVSENVVDIDTYGAPWKHWRALLVTLSEPKTVFLTVGMAGGFGADSVRDILGIPFDIPKGIESKLYPMTIGPQIAAASEFASIVEAIETKKHGNARYIGVRLEPKG